MDRRTKILAGLFAVVVGYGIFSSVVYPTWIEPLVTIDDRIAARQRDLDKLLDKEREVDQAKREYVAMIERIGSVDPGKVENDLRERLNVLIAKHDLTGASVTPGRPSFDRKTGVAKMTISVSASGTLESAILFLRDVTELPHLIRVGTVALSPVRSSRKIRQADRVNLRVPITAKVLPQKKILGKKIEQDELSQPDRLVRHLGRDYSPIWAGTPFTRYIKLDPLVVTVKRGDIKVNVNQRGVRFEVSVKGGDGRYSYSWSPKEGLTGDRSPRPKVDTKEPGERSYIVTVSDSSGNEVQRVVTVDVQEKPKITKTADKPRAPPPPPPPKDIRWKDRRHQTIIGSWVRITDGERSGELVIDNKKTRQTEYYGTGEDFDGGQLVYVHPRGGLVVRGGEYFVYPLGEKLDADVALADAVEFPELQRAADLIGPADEPEGDQDAAPDESNGSDEPEADAKPQAAGEKNLTDAAASEEATQEAGDPVAPPHNETTGKNGVPSKAVGEAPADADKAGSPPNPSDKPGVDGSGAAQEAPKPAGKDEKPAAQKPGAEAGAAPAEAKNKTNTGGAQGKAVPPTAPRPKADGGTKRNTSRGRTRQPRNIQKGTMNERSKRRSE